MIKLIVNGQAYSGWKTAQVTRSLDAVAGGFSLSVSERWAGQDQVWPFQDGDACSVELNGETVITGFVDRIDTSYDSTERSVTVSGRDATSDLVDCSVNLGKWEFGGVPLLKLASTICEQYGISVALQPGLVLPNPPAKFTLAPGDKSFDALEKACRLAGVLMVSDGLGGLVLTQPATTLSVTALIEGQNILACSAQYDSSNKFRNYIVLGQAKATEDWFGDGPTRVKGTATDRTVNRDNRTLVVRAEGAVSLDYARKRAEWEATTRAAKASTVSVTVQGWTQSDGSLWSVNNLVSIKSPRVYVNGTMLITKTVFSVDDKSGTTTQMTLSNPNSFKPEPTITKASQVWKEIAGGV